MLDLTGKEKRFLVFIAVTIVFLALGEQFLRSYRLGLAKELEETYALELQDTVVSKEPEVEAEPLITNEKTEENETLEVKDPVTPKVNINTATSEELQKVKGIGPVLAKRIIAYREKVGRFLSLDELREVKGIGAKTLEKLKPYLTI